MSDRRRAARFRARQECTRRKWRKKLSCHPWRLWPVGTRNREWWDAVQSGNMTRILKWHYPAGIADQMLEHSPFFGMLRRV